MLLVVAPIPTRRVLINYRLVMTCCFCWCLLPRRTRRGPRSVLKVEMRATPRCQRLLLFSASIRNCANPHAAAARPPSGTKFHGPSKRQSAGAHASSLPWLQPVTAPQAGPASRGEGQEKKKSPPPPRFEVVERRTGMQLMRAKQRLG